MKRNAFLRFLKGFVITRRKLGSLFHLVRRPKISTPTETRDFVVGNICVWSVRLCNFWRFWAQGKQNLTFDATSAAIFGQLKRLRSLRPFVFGPRALRSLHDTLGCATVVGGPPDDNISEPVLLTGVFVAALRRPSREIDRWPSLSRTSPIDIGIGDSAI